MKGEKGERGKGWKGGKEENELLTLFNYGCYTSNRKREYFCKGILTIEVN